MSLSLDKVPMSREEFRLLRDLVYEYCGIFFQEDVKYLLERRLNARLREHQLQSFTEYHRYLRYSASRRVELEEIVELLTTNETYFFREEYQLKAFSEEQVEIGMCQRRDPAEAFDQPAGGEHWLRGSLRRHPPTLLIHWSSATATRMRAPMAKFW